MLGVKLATLEIALGELKVVEEARTVSLSGGGQEAGGSEELHGCEGVCPC